MKHLSTEHYQTRLVKVVNHETKTVEEKPSTDLTFACGQRLTIQQRDIENGKLKSGARSRYFVITEAAAETTCRACQKTKFYREALAASI